MVRCEPVQASDNPEEMTAKLGVLGISPSRKSSLTQESMSPKL